MGLPSRILLESGEVIPIWLIPVCFLVGVPLALFTGPFVLRWVPDAAIVALTISALATRKRFRVSYPVFCLAAPFTLYVAVKLFPEL